MHDSAASLGNTKHADPPYVMIWVVLLVLMFVSIALGHIANVYWMNALVFSVAAVKAFLVARYYMHLKFEPLFVTVLLITALLFVVAFFWGTYPDVVARTAWTQH